MNKIILILGNGFDMNLGLPTSYHHLVNSTEFQQEILKGNSLAQHLKTKENTIFNWIGLENELVVYANSVIPDREIFLQEFTALKNTISTYYKRINDTEVIKFGMASDVFIENYVGRLQHPDEELLILNFNYTCTPMRILDAHGKTPGKFLKYADQILDIISCFTGEPYTPKLKHLKEIHPHGTIDNNIIFGVSDKENVGEYIFLKKSVDRYYSPMFSSDDLLSANEIIIFGHSLGKTDHHYFKDFFMRQSDIGAERKSIRIYYYGEQERLKLMSELDCLTEHRLSNLQMNNKVKFIDSSITNYDVTYH